MAKRTRKKSPTKPRVSGADTVPLPDGLRVRNRGVQQVPVSDIVDNPLNFRTHDPLQRASFEATVAEVGWYGYPDVFELPDQPGTFMLIDGELRSHHLRDRYGPDAQVAVNVTDFDLDEARKALATKDPLAAMATVDRQQLAEVLRGIDADSDKFQQLIELLAKQERVDLEPLADDVWDEDELPEPTAELAAKFGVEPGVLFVVNGAARHRVLCGDAENAADVKRLLADADPFLLISHPPDGPPPLAALAEFRGPVAYVFYSAGYAGETVARLAEAKFKVRCQLIWRCERPSSGKLGHYRDDHDPCLYAVRDGRSALWNGARDQSTMAEANYPHVSGAPPQIGRAHV